MQTESSPLSFFHLPPDCGAGEVFLIVPVPYEGTACFLKGTANAPAAILSVSDQMEDFDEETHTSILRHGIATLPPILPADTPEEEFLRIYDTVMSKGNLDNKLFSKGHFPIFLGGEHSITPPLVKAAVESFRYFKRETVSNVSVLQFDAHADLRNSYIGGKFSHASAMRRILEWTPNLVQVGIRSYSAEEYKECPDRINSVITPQQIREDFNGSIKRILDGLKPRVTIDGLHQFVYITIDIDVFDPAFAPGTGTPEPGGLDWFQVCSILREVFRNKTVIGADIVEVMPLGGNNVITEFLAARLIEKIIAYKQEQNDLWI